MKYFFEIENWQTYFVSFLSREAMLPPHPCTLRPWEIPFISNVPGFYDCVA
jgi:hypothetical protein